MLFIPQDLIQNPNIKNIDITTWCLCNIVVNSPIKDSDLITVSQLAYHIHNNTDVSSKTKEEISTSIQRLLDMNFLIGVRVGKQYYEIFKDSFFVDQDNLFIKVEEKDIKTILDKHPRPFAVLHYYLVVLSTINAKTKYGTWSRERIADLVGQNPVTFSRYNKFLEDEQLLYIYRSYSEGKHYTNVYSRYEDKGYAKRFGTWRSEGHEVTEKANLKRRYTQMYNMIKSGRKTYSPEEMKQIKAYCIEENARRQQIYEKNPSYTQQFFDLSVFS